MSTATLHGCLALPSHPGIQIPMPWSENYARGLPYMAYPKKSALMVDNHTRPMKCRHFWPLGECPTGCHLPTTHNPMAELQMLWKPPNGCFMTTSPVAVSTQTASLVPSSNIRIHLCRKSDTPQLSSSMASQHQTGVAGSSSRPWKGHGQTHCDNTESFNARHGARPFPALCGGDLVAIQNQSGNSPRRWDKTGIVKEVRPNRQYLIQLHGLNRLTLRNQAHLRKIVPVLKGKAPTPPPYAMALPAPATTHAPAPAPSSAQPPIATPAQASATPTSPQPQSAGTHSPSNLPADNPAPSPTVPTTPSLTNDNCVPPSYPSPSPEPGPRCQPQRSRNPPKWHAEYVMGRWRVIPLHELHTSNEPTTLTLAIILSTLRCTRWTTERQASLGSMLATSFIGGRRGI